MITYLFQISFRKILHPKRLRLSILKNIQFSITHHYKIIKFYINTYVRAKSNAKHQISSISHDKTQFFLSQNFKHKHHTQQPLNINYPPTFWIGHPMQFTKPFFRKMMTVRERPVHDLLEVSKINLPGSGFADFNRAGAFFSSVLVFDESVHIFFRIYSRFSTSRYIVLLRVIRNCCCLAISMTECLSKRQRKQIFEWLFFLKINIGFFCSCRTFSEIQVYLLPSLRENMRKPKIYYWQLVWEGDVSFTLSMNKNKRSLKVWGADFNIDFVYTIRFRIYFFESALYIFW